MDSCDSVVLVVRPEAEEAWAPPTSVVVTERKGPTDPKARIPGQLRYEIGRYSYLLNLVHTPDELTDVARELGVHFDTATRERVYASALEGADQSGRALELAARLHAEVPERELTFAAGRSAKLRLAVERAEASMPPGRSATNSARPGWRRAPRRATAHCWRPSGETAC